MQYCYTVLLGNKGVTKNLENPLICLQLSFTAKLIIIKKSNCISSYKKSGIKHKFQNNRAKPFIMFALLTDAKIQQVTISLCQISIMFPSKGHIKIKLLKMVIPPTSTTIKNVRSFMSKYQHDINIFHRIFHQLHVIQHQERNHCMADCQLNCCNPETFSP
jgi:hypothetical protein